MSSRSFTRPRSRRSYWVPVVLVVWAVFLALGPIRFRSPVVVPAPVPAWATDATPARRPSRQPTYTVGKFTYRCSECHRTVPEPRAAGAGFTKHSEIHLAHGMNTACLNCHHPVNREAFVGYQGKEIPWDQPQLLCAECHGPVYRDWQHGSHGRLNGYWDKSQGEQVRLKCIQCHDPHHPPFHSIASAPPPHTLRVEPHAVAAHHGTRNPLRLHDNHQADHDAAVPREGH